MSKAKGDVPVLDTTQVLKKGTLGKQGGFRKNWLDRHFLLTTNMLAYFENESLSKEKVRACCIASALVTHVVVPLQHMPFVANSSDVQPVPKLASRPTPTRKSRHPLTPDPGTIEIARAVEVPQRDSLGRLLSL